MRRLLLPGNENNFRPWFLHLRGLLSLLFLFLLVFFTLPSLAGMFPQPAVLGWQENNLSATRIVELINQLRQHQGLPPLVINRRLEYAAFLKADDMFAKNYWAHRSPDGHQPWYFIEAAGYSYQAAGENLAKNFNDSRQLVEAWLRSPSHRRNLLEKNYTQIGVSVVQGELNHQPTTLVVAFFAKPLDNQTAALVKDVLAKDMPSQFYFHQSSSSSLNLFTLEKRFDVGILLLLLLAALADYYFTEKKLPRRYHSYSRLHLVFFTLLLIMIFLTHQVGGVK